MRLFAPAALIAALLLSACGKQAPPPPPPKEVGVVAVQMQPITLTTELPGRTSPFESSEVRPQVDGIITSRLFQEGQTVHAGQTLYQIDPAPYAAAAANARAALSRAQANIASTAALAQRYGDLVKINAIAKQDYENSVAAANQAKADVAAQRAALAIGRRSICGAPRCQAAPISGRIGASTFTAGALVTAAQTRAAGRRSSGSIRSMSISTSRASIVLQACASQVLATGNCRAAAARPACS